MPVAFVVAAPMALAADWQFNPTVQVGGMKDDNLRLESVGPEADVAGLFTLAEFEFRALTPISDFSITPAVDATYFPGSGDEDEDYTNGSLSLDWTRTGQTVFSRFNASYADEATVQGNRVSTDAQGGGLGNPEGGASGGLLLRNRVDTLRVGEYLRFDLSERHAIEGTLSYQDRSFDLQVPGSDVSYSSLNADLGWRQALNERTSLTLRGTYLHYDPDLIGGTSESYGFEGQWDRKLSERFDGYFRLGATKTNYQDATVATNDDTAFVGGIGGSWRFQTARLFLDLTRNIDPNSAGYSTKRDQVRVRLNKDVSERLGLLAAFRYVKDDGPTTLFTDRDYLVGTLGAEWRFRQTWSLLGRYDYSRLKYDGPSNSASSNAIRLSIVYQPARAGSPMRVRSLLDR